MVTFVDPRGVAATEPLPYELHAGLEPGSRIALMANGFPDSAAFLEHVATALTPLLPGVEFDRFDKGDASTLASESMLDDAARCDAVIAAYGH